MHNDVQTSRKIHWKITPKTTKNVDFAFQIRQKSSMKREKSVGPSKFHLQERFFRLQERFWASQGVPRRAIFFRQCFFFSNVHIEGNTRVGKGTKMVDELNEVEKEIAKENRKNTDEGDMEQDKSNPIAKPYLNKPEWKALHDMDDKIIHAYLKHKEHKTNEAALDEGKLKDWAKSLAMAGVFVAGMAGVGSIQDAINNSVPAIQAMNTALEMAQDRGDDNLVAQIEKDIKDAKLRLDIGRDLNQVKYLQDKYEKFIATESLAYESKLAMMLNQHIK